MGVIAIGSHVAGQNILLDGAKLINSTFDGCTFIYSGGNFPVIEGCKIIGCYFSLEGPEHKNQELARALRAIGVK